MTQTYTYKPVTVSFTEYLNGKQTRATQTSTKPLWAAAPAYTAQRLAAGQSASSADCRTRTETFYTYDSQGRQSRMLTREYESQAEIAGGLSLQFVFEDIDGGGSVSLSNAEIQTSETIVEKFYAGNFEKTVTSRYLHWAKTQAGQQNSSESRLTFESAARTQSYVIAISGSGLLADGMEVQTTITSPENQVDAVAVETQTGQDQPKPVDLERRAYGKPAATEKYGRNEFNVEVVQETANILYRYGTVDADRVIRLSLPYADDAAFYPDGEVTISPGTGGGAAGSGLLYMPTNWTPKLSRVQEQALQFGRVQNRLLIGNRQGVSLQLPAELLPSQPFDPLYIKADNLTGQYRVNAASWTFSSDGIVASVDALFWGGVGS